MSNNRVIIEGVGIFTVDGDVVVNGGDLTFDSKELVEMVADLKTVIATSVDTVEDTEESAPPPPSYEVQYETAPGSKYTIEDLKNAGWSVAQMLSGGYIVEVTPEPVVEEAAAPPPPVVEEAAAPPPPVDEGVDEEEFIAPEPKVLGPNEFEVDGELYEMQPIAKGVPYESFIATSGWTLQLLLKHKFVVKKSDSKPDVIDEQQEDAPPKPVMKKPLPASEYPILNDEGDWEDITGAIFDPELHGKSKDKNMPAVKVNGEFKTRRNIGKKSSKKEDAANAVKEEILNAAPPPPADEASAPPPPADEASAPPPPADDGSNVVESDDLEDELASIIKGWG